MKAHVYKVGDLVRIVGDPKPTAGLGLNTVHPVDSVSPGVVRIRDNDGDNRVFWLREVEPVEPEAPKGTMDRLLIEALPQGGYKITTPGSSWGAKDADIAARSTLAEVVAFVSANMR